MSARRAAPLLALLLVLEPLAAAAQNDDALMASLEADMAKKAAKKKKKAKHAWLHKKAAVVPESVAPPPPRHRAHASKHAKHEDAEEAEAADPLWDNEPAPAPKKRRGHPRAAEEAAPPAEEPAAAPGAEPADPAPDPGEGADAEAGGEDGAAESSPVEVEFQGYVRARLTHTFVDTHALLSGVTAPVSENFGTLEANIQPKLKLFGHLTLAGDISVLGTTDAPYVSLLANELYTQVTLFDSVYVLAGRRRVVWGTGLAWNPTDLVNPPRDLLEPARTRAGALMLPMVDVALSQVTLSAFVSTPVTYSAYGIPQQVGITTPLAGARVFTNQLGTDMSAMYFYDSAKQRHSIGTAVSSIIADNYEVHAEGVVHLGSVDRPPMQAVDACGPSLGPAPKYGGAAVVGARRDWSDRSLVALEYLYNSAGYSPLEYSLVRTELPCLRSAAHVAQLRDPAHATAVQQSVVLVRQHYLSLIAQRPHLTEDGWLEHLGVSGGAIVSLSDGSTLVHARVDFSMGAFVLSLSGAAVAGPNGAEMTLAPMRGMMFVEAQWSY